MSRNFPVRASLIGARLTTFGLVLVVAGGLLRWSWTPWQAVYVVAAAGLVAWLSPRIRRGLLATAGEEHWTEEVRWATLPALAVWLYRPFLTPEFFGGTDARSYAYGMIDVLTQARAGVFPVFVGQTEFMFEGVIHPIRTAPFHQHFGMLLDVLTARALSPVAVQHLTVVLTAILAAVICYLCLVSLAPLWRWLAWAMTALYVSAPAGMGFIYSQEMYMTFMAFAWLPVVVWGNVRLIRRDDWTGWHILVGGLAIVWFCHPPVGAWLTVATAMIQALRLLTGETLPGAWLRVLAAAGLFVGLTAYYFWSVREVMATGQHMGEGPGARVLPAVGLTVGFALLFRFLAKGDWKIPVFALLLIGQLWIKVANYGRWLLASVLCATIVVIAMRRHRQILGRHVPEVAIASVLLGGLLASPWFSVTGLVVPFEIVRGLFPKNFLPLSTSASLLPDLQLGYGLMLAWFAGVAALFVTRSLEIRLPVLAAIVGMLLLVPLPGLTRFLLGHVPAPLSAISSPSYWLRFLPTLVALCVFVGFLGAVAFAARGPRGGRVVSVLAAAMLCWSLVESTKFIGSGQRAIETTGQHRDVFRPENVTQFAYIFAGVPLSPYLVNGVADYQLESRLLSISDPAKEVGETVPWPDPVWQPLEATIEPGNPAWLNLTPAVTLAPGEHRLLRFRFFDRPYDGVLIMRGPGGWYREYQLPVAGFGLKSFGVAPVRPKTLALWNTGPQPQSVEISFVQHTLPADGIAPSVFAEFAMLTYDPGTLRIRTEHLVPYRASVTAAEPVYLETLRTFIPGYRALVNGQQRPVEASPNYKAMVRLDAGENRVELRYVGTKALWSALVVSGLTWGAWVVTMLVRLRRKNATAVGVRSLA